MSDWSWIALGYGIAYSAIIGYGAALRWRQTKVRRQMAALR